jgi:hypothetical protein
VLDVVSHARLDQTLIDESKARAKAIGFTIFAPLSYRVDMCRSVHCVAWNEGC